MSSRGPLSPEPSEEGFGSYGGGGGGCTLGGKPPNSLKLSSSEMPPQVHFITANVGSIFEEPTLLIPQWLDQVMGEIQRQNPKFVAIHCQEVRGPGTSFLTFKVLFRIFNPVAKFPLNLRKPPLINLLNIQTLMNPSNGFFR